MSQSDKQKTLITISIAIITILTEKLTFPLALRQNKKQGRKLPFLEFFFSDRKQQL